MVTAKSFDKLKKELDEIREKSCRKYSINFSLMSNTFKTKVKTFLFRMAFC